MSDSNVLTEEQYHYVLARFFVFVFLTRISIWLNDPWHSLDTIYVDENGPVLRSRREMIWGRALESDWVSDPTQETETYIGLYLAITFHSTCFIMSLYDPVSINIFVYHIGAFLIVNRIIYVFAKCNLGRAELDLDRLQRARDAIKSKCVV